MWKKLKHRFAKWIWKDNDWTKAVDGIEQAAKDVNSGRYETSMMKWQFKFLPEPNKFTITVRLSEPDKAGKREIMSECKNDLKCDNCSIETIVKEILECHFRCSGGRLESHRGYMALVSRAKQFQAQLKDRTKDEIKALIEKYGDPQYKTSEFALYDVIGTAQQLHAQVKAAERKMQLHAGDICSANNEADLHIEKNKDLEEENTKLQGEIKEQKEATKQCLSLCTVKEDAELIVKLQAEIKGLREELRWIPVSERLPENDEEVIILAGDVKTPYIANALLKGAIWHIRHPNGIILAASWEITHWKPITLPDQALRQKERE